LSWLVKIGEERIMKTSNVTIFTAALVALVVSVFVQVLGPQAQTGRPQQSVLAAKEPVFARISQSGVLRCGYVLYPPFVLKDPNSGKLSGLFVELTEKLGELAGWKVEWSAETSYATIVEDMSAGKYDVYCGGSWVFFPTARYWANSIPAFYSPVLIYARANDTRFDDSFDPAKLNDPSYKFAAFDGELSQIAQQEDFPRASTLQLPQFTHVSDLALNVATGKADVTIIERGVANSYMEHNPGSLKEISHGRPVRIFGDTWQFAFGETALRQVIDNAINDMLQSGYVEKVLRTYEKTPGTYYRAAPLYQIPH
jgi:polar amino acid transport system substrate-binding protein